MQYSFSNLTEKAGGVLLWLSGELASLRTGRANPALLDKVFVDVYGTKTPLTHLGSVSIEDARTLRVTLWDRGNVGPVREAIDRANIGVSVVPDDTGLRVIVPELTHESRKNILKIVGERIEEARISLRRERDIAWHDIQTKEKAKEFSEDDKFRYKEKLESLIGDYMKKMELLRDKKEKEVLGK